MQPAKPETRSRRRRRVRRLRTVCLGTRGYRVLSSPPFTGETTKSTRTCCRKTSGNSCQATRSRHKRLELALPAPWFELNPRRVLSPTPCETLRYDEISRRQDISRLFWGTNTLDAHGSFIEKQERREVRIGTIGQDYLELPLARTYEESGLRELGHMQES